MRFYQNFGVLTFLFVIETNSFVQAMSNNSMSKTKVAHGGITLPTPSSPYAISGGIKMNITLYTVLLWP